MNAREPIVSERRVYCRGELLRGVRNATEPEIAVRMDNICNRCGDHGPAAGKILGRLRRTDVPSGLIASERQHGDVPACQVLRQLGVRLLTEVVNICRSGQR